MSAPIVVLPLIRGDDGTWEAMVEVVRSGEDLETREAETLVKPTRASVRVLGALKELEVFVDDDGDAVVRYSDALDA